MDFHGQDLYGSSVDPTWLRKQIGMVFQKANPFPMSIYDNVAYGPRTHGIRNRVKLDEIVENSLRSAAIWDEVKDRLKKNALGLSGGQQQRLCIARALAVKPEVLLMDEPLSNLDAALRVRMRGELKRLQRELGTTMVFVTHDQEEALILADSIAVMSEGELLQLGSAEEVFRHPANDYIASFLGLNDIVWKDDGSVLKVIRHGEKG